MNISVDQNSTGTSIRTLVEANPVLVLIEPEKFEPFFESIKAEVMAHVPDLTSAKGRDAIKSLAFKVVRTKTAIDDAGKKLNEAARSQINKVDASRRDIKARLEDLAEQVRAPLTAWEDAEDKRIDYVNSELSDLRGAPNFPRTWAPAKLLEEIQALKARTFDPAKFQDQTDTAIALRDAAVLAMEAAHARLVKEEEDRAELERLRTEAAERKRQDDERAAKEEAERRRVAAAEAAEKRRTENEQAEKDRIAAAEKRAAENAKAEAERAHQAEIDRLNREAAKVEADRKARDERLEREEQARRDEAKRIADEDASRARNKTHRAKIEREVQAALVTVFEGFGISDKPMLATRIVDAIACGDVPHTSIKF